MKICMLAPEFPPVWGGVGTYIFELIKHLPKSIEVHVLAPMRKGYGKNQASAELEIDFSRCFGNNIYVHYICEASDTFFYNAAFQYACLRYAPKLLKDENIDLIHSHTAHMPDLLLKLRRLDNPIITTVHTTIKSQRLGTSLSHRSFFELERSEKMTFIMYPFLRMAEMAYFRGKRLYISPSKWMKHSLEDFYNITKNIRVIPNSVDLEDYKRKELDFKLKGLIQQKIGNKRIVLFAGRLLALKGVDILIDAIPKILKENPTESLHFVFAGPGNKIRYLDKVRRMGLSGCCSFIGPLPKEQIIQLIQASSIVVLPSLIENFPYIILESMACGVPVVANNIGGIPEIIEDGYNGKLIKSLSPRNLAMTILNLLQDESLRSSLGKHARETINNKFSWTVNIKKYCELYSDALTQSTWRGTE